MSLGGLLWPVSGAIAHTYRASDMAGGWEFTLTTSSMRSHNGDGGVWVGTELQVHQASAGVHRYCKKLKIGTSFVLGVQYTGMERALTPWKPEGGKGWGLRSGRAAFREIPWAPPKFCSESKYRLAAPADLDTCLHCIQFLLYSIHP